MVRFSSLIISLLAAEVSAFTNPGSHVPRQASVLRMSEDTDNKDPVKVGVIGCGRIGIVHLGAINKAPGVVPVVVSNPTVSKAENGERYGFLRGGRIPTSSLTPYLDRATISREAVWCAEVYGRCDGCYH